MLEYERLRNEKLVKINKHPSLPICNINYTSRVNFRKGKWSKELLIARGLVVDNNGTIIGRPIPKFFNDYEITPPSGDFEVTEKMDGSLIIMSFYSGEAVFSTRGSFTSEQAMKAKEIYTRKYSHIETDQAFTYCFEVIYPQNKIVVDYDEVEDLFLLAKINTETGEEIDDSCFKQVKKYNLTYDEMKKMDLRNKEGFVVRFLENNFRMKIKFKTYILLHKNKTISREQILKQMKRGEIEAPDECSEELKTILDDINNEHSNLKTKILEEYEDFNEENIIEQIKYSVYSKIMFAIRNGKKYDKLILDLIK
jgi:RNA ligase